MSGFISEMIGQFTHSGHGGGGGGDGGQQQGGYGGNQQYQQSGPPQVPPPWVARWDNNRGCWYYVNEQTGEQSLEHPGNRGYGGYPQQQQQYQGQQGYNQPPPTEKHGHGNMALGAAAGLVGGAALMYEGDKIRMFPPPAHLFQNMFSFPELTCDKSHQMKTTKRTNIALKAM